MSAKWVVGLLYEHLLCEGCIWNGVVVEAAEGWSALHRDVVHIFVLQLHVRRPPKVVATENFTMLNAGLMSVSGTTIKSGFQSRPHTAYTRRLVNAKQAIVRTPLGERQVNAPEKAR